MLVVSWGVLGIVRIIAIKDCGEMFLRVWKVNQQTNLIILAQGLEKESLFNVLLKASEVVFQRADATPVNAPPASC